MRPALSFSSLLREAARTRDSWPVGLFYLGYAALYVILDQLTFGRPSGLGTTPGIRRPAWRCSCSLPAVCAVFRSC